MDAAIPPTLPEDPIMIDRSSVIRTAWAMARRAAARLPGTTVRQHFGACVRAAWMLARKRVLTVAAAAAVAAVTPAVAAPEQPVEVAASAPAPLDASWTDAAAAITEQDAVDTASLSCDIDLAKWDRRCRGWGIVVRDCTAIPSPEAVTGASSLRLPYVRQYGTEELFGTDALLQGEENHHRKVRGWRYRLYVRDPEDNRYGEIVPNEHAKQRIKVALESGRCTMPRGYLRGSGEVAAMVRILHAIRHGMTVADFL